MTSPPPSRNDGIWLAFALVVALLTITFQMGSLPLIQPDEGRNAEVAREMKERGAWLVPTHNGQVYLDKPAFYFKAVAISLAAFGDTEFAARLPSVLFAFGTLGISWLFARGRLNPRAAAIAVLVTATTPLFIIHARTIIFDVALTLFICSAIIAGHLAEAGPGRPCRGWHLVAALSAGLGTLVKGPVGFAVPALVLIVHHLVEGRPRAVLRMFHPLNAAAFVVVVLPWFIGLSIAQPDFPHYGLVEETFNRFTTVKFQRTQPFHFYAWVVPATFLPWSLLLPQAAPMALWRWRSLGPVPRFAIIWSLVVVAFFSLSKSKLPGYVMSIAVPWGWLIGAIIDSAMTNPKGSARRVVRNATGVLGAITLSAALAICFFGDAIVKMIRTNPDIDPTRIQTAWLPLLVMTCAVAIVAILGWSLRKPGWGAAAFGVFPMLLVTLGGDVFLAVYDSRSARKMAQTMPRFSEETQVVFYRCMPVGLPFYLGRTGTLITKDGRELASNYVKYSLARHPERPPGIVDFDQFTVWFQQVRTPVYLVVQRHDEPWLRELAASRGATVQGFFQGYYGALIPPKEAL
jgi:4-amino-4-deoxy-L-arabinose transferase-like glycosyltransferase